MSVCKSCGATIKWAETEKGSGIPLDPNPVADGNLIVVRHVPKGTPGRPVVKYLSKTDELPGDVARFKSHFVTCPEAKAHRRARRPR